MSQYTPPDRAERLRLVRLALYADDAASRYNAILAMQAHLQRCESRVKELEDRIEEIGVEAYTGL